MNNVTGWLRWPLRAAPTRLTAAAALALSLVFQAPLSAAAEVAPSTGGSASPQAAGQTAQAAQQLLYTVRGTPHEWLRDEQGVFRWVGDLTALNRKLYPPREYTIQDPLDPALRRSLDTPESITFEQLMASPRGEPLISTAFIELQGQIYYPRWNPLEDEPTLLRLASPDDLAIFGVTAENRSRLVLTAEQWQSRFNLSTRRLERGQLRAAAPERPSALPCIPIVLAISPVTNGAQAEVHNPCDGARRAWLGAVLYDAPGGRPLATTATARVDISVGETRTVSLSAEPTRGLGGPPPGAPPPGEGAPPGRQPPPRTPIDAGWIQPLINGTAVPNWVPLASNAASRAEQEAAIAAGRNEVFNDEDYLRPVCMDVGASVGCLRIDPRLRQTVEVLKGTAAGPEVLAAAAEWGVDVRYGALFGALGVYESRRRSITIGATLDQYSDWERAVVLVHELQHALDHARGRIPTRSAVECLAVEREAFERGSAVWRQLWNNRFPEPRGDIQEMLNRIAVQSVEDPTAYTRAMTRSYRHQCDR